MAMVIQVVSLKISVQVRNTQISKHWFVCCSNFLNASLRVASVVELSWANLDGLKPGTAAPNNLACVAISSLSE